MEVSGVNTMEILESEAVFTIPFLTVHREKIRQASGVRNLYRVDKEDFAMVVALTLQEEVLLVRQYKHGAGGHVYELPAGYLNAGETGEAGARRELLEETGYAAASMEPLGSFLTVPGFLTTRGHFFLARKAVRVSEPRPDAHEEIEVTALPFADVVRRLRGFDFAMLSDVNSVLALLLADEQHRISVAGRPPKARPRSK
jgi:ADP-ribose pyrophosphatase